MALKKKSTFFKILISYVIILLIPMLSLGTMVFDFFFRTYNTELLRSFTDGLTGFKVSADSMISGLNANAYMLLNSKEFTTRYLCDSYGNFYDVADSLSGVTLTNDFVTGSFYANNDLKEIISGLSVYSYEDFELYNNGYGAAPNEMEKLLFKNARSYWIQAQNVGNAEKTSVLTYVVTDKVGTSPVSSSLFFQISTEKLDLLAGRSGGQQSCMLIAGTGGELLYTSKDDCGAREWEHWLESGEQKTDTPVNLDIDGKTYTFLQSASDKSPLIFASIVPYEEVMSPIRENQRNFLLGTVAIAVVCAAFIAYFMKLNYSPIRAIVKLAGSMFGENKEVSELESTRMALVSINARQAELMRERLTLKLIRGGFESLEELESDGARYDYPLTGPMFRVIVFRMDGEKRLEQESYEEVIRLIEGSMSVYTQAVCVNYSEGDNIFLVISGDETELRHLSQKYSQIKNVIENTFSTCLSIGVGNVEAVGSVHKSSAQATSASNYSFVRGKGSITFYDEIEDEKGKITPPYPSRELDMLYNAILRGESERAEFAMSGLTRYIQKSNSFFYGMCLTYDILNTALRAMRELGIETAGIENFSGKGTPLSVDDVVLFVKSITDEIVLVLSESEENAPSPALHPNQLEQIISYIKENYQEESFSVKTLAAHFELSGSNLSHYFKKNTGQTVSEYISLLRFEKAKELLCKTNMNLQEIARSCGYLHLSTFMRQFKQRAGCTPANFRVK